MQCIVKNANYERVLEVLQRLLNDKSSSFCSCSDCLNEIAATALNCLPTHYYVNEKMVDEVGSPWIMVENAVQEAIERVVEHLRNAHETAHHKISRS